MSDAADPPASGRRRRRVVTGAVVASLAVVTGVVVMATRSSDGSGGSGGASGDCLPDLVDDVPTDASFLQGADLARARTAGLDDEAGIEEASDWLLETGVPPDPLTTDVWQEGDDPAAALGYEPADIRCWAGAGRAFAARGSFDAGRVTASDVGSQSELDVRDNLLVHPDGPGDTDPAGADSPTRARIVELLADHGALAFSAMGENDAGDVWSAVGLARGDGWELLAVWAFADETLADEGEDRVREALSDGSSVRDMVSGDPLERLERDGTTLSLQAPLTAATTTWYSLQAQLDPIFLVSD